MSVQTHDAALDFGSDFEGISAYELSGCFIGGCYLPIMTTTYMIFPEDDDHYTACGCRWTPNPNRNPNSDPDPTFLQQLRAPANTVVVPVPTKARDQLLSAD